MHNSFVDLTIFYYIDKNVGYQKQKYDYCITYFAQLAPHLFQNGYIFLKHPVYFAVLIERSESDLKLIFTSLSRLCVIAKLLCSSRKGVTDM